MESLARPGSGDQGDILVGFDESKSGKAMKALQKREGAIRSYLHPDETLDLIAISNANYSEFAAVTNARTVFFDKKGRVLKELAHGAVAGVVVKPGPSGLLVEIESHAAAKYAPDDWKRYQHVIQIPVATPAAANAVRLAVYQRL
jgi:hypothetical protein